jgi:TPR repeat protein
MNSRCPPDQSIAAVGLAAYFRLRARAEDVFAQFVSGVCLENGSADRINPVVAATYCQLVAEHNSAPTQYFYAECLARNLVEAIRYYTLAADQVTLLSRLL